MGLISAIVDVTRTDEDGVPVYDITVDTGGGANVTARYVSPPGDDSPPRVGDSALVIDGPQTGSAVVVGLIDGTSRSAGLGEKRFFSRDGDGNPIAWVWLKADGEVEIRNEHGHFIMEPEGAVTINGVVIDIDGNILAPGEVTAQSDTAPVGLSTHLHNTAMGPTDAPTPGT